MSALDERDRDEMPYRYTVWHNNIGRPYTYDDGWQYEGRSGVSPGTLAEWLDCVRRFGAAITKPWDAPRPSHHHVIGCGVGHSDVDWCESRFEQGSMAAYYESGEAFRGERWWDTTDQPWHGYRTLEWRYYVPTCERCGRELTDSDHPKKCNKRKVA